MDTLLPPGALPALLAVLAVLAWPGSRGPAQFTVRGRRLRHHRPVVSEPPVADVLDLVALALDGGVGSGAALRQVADRLPGAAGAELRTVAAALEWGLPEAAAWSAAPARWAPAGRALRLSTRAGVPPAALLRRAAEDQRREQLAAVEEATARLGVRLVLPLGLVFLPAFVLTTVVPMVLALAGSLLSP